LAPAPLAAAWLELIQNRERRIRLGEAAREDAVTRFDFDGMAVSLESSYETWLQARGASE
jgi:hypothetical protein